MKVLIWILCIFAWSVLTTYLEFSGIYLGALPTILLILFTWFVARSLCRKWDEHKGVGTDVADLADDYVENNNKEETDNVRYCRKCGAQLLENSKFCRICGAEIDIEYD